MVSKWGNNGNRKQWKQRQTLFSWAPKSLWIVIAAMKLKDTCSLEEKLWWTSTVYKKQRHHFVDKYPYSQSYSYVTISSSHIQIWELDHKEGLVLKIWCFWTVVLGKTLESPLDCKIKPVNPKGNQSWIFFGRTDAEAEAPIIWPPDAKSQLIGKDPDGGKYWGQGEKSRTEDEMVGWYHLFNGH